MSNHYIEERSLSVAWAKALQLASRPGHKEIGPLTVAVTGFDEEGVVTETDCIRDAIDEVLVAAEKPSVDTVANTIFPHSLWNPSAQRSQLFERYRRILPTLKSQTENRRGIYFERMITGGGPAYPNQLEHALSMRGKRRSALQVATFNPTIDHSKMPRVGFPCLQHLTFAPCEGVLNVNAFYATQYLVTRAYGNYLGLCRLGRFMAHELEMPLGRLTCLVGIAMRDSAKFKLSGVYEALALEGSTNESRGQIEL